MKDEILRCAAEVADKWEAYKADADTSNPHDFPGFDEWLDRLELAVRQDRDRAKVG